MCRFCNDENKKDFFFVAFPFFHEGAEPDTGLRLVRVNMRMQDPECEKEEIWNVCSVTSEGTMSSIAYYCPRCGRMLTEHESALDFDEVTTDENIIEV